jgi:peptidyl-prolyl cis-trans isomerase B (cyclophilin B)
MAMPPSPYGAYPPPPPYAGGYGAPPRSTNGLAITSLVCAFVFAPLAILFGHISLSQIKRSGQDGRGLAIAGLILGYLFTVLGVVLIIAALVWTAAVFDSFDKRFRDRYYPRDDPSATAFPNAPASTLPTFAPPATLGSNCQYPATTEAPSKPVEPPQSGRIPTTPPIVGATIATSDGVIGLELDNAKAPCTVNNFTSLARQGYFDNTSCHRLTTSDALGVLQCGDPTGDGSGGPGYRFPNEYPTNQYRLSDPTLSQPVLYPRGTLAMANAGSGTNGSQFFFVYKDSQLPPSYTVFGTVDAAGLAVVDKVAAGGVQGGSEDGKPATGISIQSVTVK